MSEPIKVGDLVVVIKPTPCCANTNNLGRVFVVDNIYSGQTAGCAHCSCQGAWATLVRSAGERDGVEPERLKRIPPLSELDDVKQAEEIHA